MIKSRIGFIGAGNMANSLIRGLLAKGLDAESIWVTDIDQAKLKAISEDCGINASSLAEVANSVDVLVLAVKPQVMQSVCVDLAEHMPERDCLIVSIAAGITITHMEQWLGQSAAIVRCMPNTPALVGKGASGLFANVNVTENQKELADEIVGAVGVSAWVGSEADIDIVTAISGSGPAYFFLFMEAMQETAKGMGLSPELARLLTYQTAIGAAELALLSEEETSELRRQVTSPGGTTERAINTFEEGQLRELVDSALKAARDRSVELAKEFGKND